MKNDLLIIGAGGHSRVLIDIAIKMNHFNLIGLIDNQVSIGSKVCGVPVLGTDLDLQQMFDDNPNLKIIVGIADNSIRNKIFLRLKDIFPLNCFATLIHPSAQIGVETKIGVGVAIMAGCVINSDSQIGDFTIVNTRASLDHENDLGAFASVGPNVVTGGNVKVGKGTALEISTTVGHNVIIGENSVIGAGSLVLKDCNSNSVYYGVPVKFVRDRIKNCSFD